MRFDNRTDATSKSRGATAARTAVVAVAVGFAILGAASGSRAAIVTYGGGPLRTDLYMSMHRLVPGLVRSRAFARLFDRVLPDHGQVYTQPLLADGRLIVATEKNDVYELDPRTGRILRSRFLVPPWQPLLPTSYGPVTCRTSTRPLVSPAHR